MKGSVLKVSDASSKTMKSFLYVMSGSDAMREYIETLPHELRQRLKKRKAEKKNTSISKALLKMQTTMSITYLRTVFYAEVRVLLVDIQSETFNYFSPLVTSLILLFSILVSGICLFYFLLLFDFDF